MEGDGMSRDGVKYGHDPLCVTPHPAGISPIICSWCQLIKAVVERERSRQFPDPLANRYLSSTDGQAD